VHLINSEPPRTHPPERSWEHSSWPVARGARRRHTAIGDTAIRDTVIGAAVASTVMLADGPSIRVLPRLDQENRFFWTGGGDGILRFLRCRECRRFIHPPSPICPFCVTATLVPQAVSGRATLASFTVNHQPWIPGSAPYVVAWVAIDEQPDVRLTTNLIGVEQADLRIGMALEVAFAPAGNGIFLPLFRPMGDDHRPIREPEGPR